MTKPAAPGLHIRKWQAGRWTGSGDAVVTEEPLQVKLDGEELAVVMRTPGHDVELALGLLYAEGLIRSRDDVELVRISAESGDAADGIRVDASIVESNEIDVHVLRAPQRKRQRSMLASSACGVCGATMIDDLRSELQPLDAGQKIDPQLLPLLVERMRSGQGVFERTGGLHAAALFDRSGVLIAMREDVGRHCAVDKVVGHMLAEARLPASDTILVVSGRAGYEIVQKSLMARIPVLAAVGAPSSLAVALAREFNQTLVGFLRGDHFNVYAAEERFIA